MVLLQELKNAANGQGGQTSLDESVDSMATMLGCMDHKSVDACSISLVKEQLRKSKVEAYIPKVVSIGPLHHGTRTDLLDTEEIKWRCLMNLFNRSGEDHEECFWKCYGAMLEIDEIVRASYNVGGVKFNRVDLAKIMVLDGCFLLELLIGGSPEINEKFKCHLDTNPGAEVIKMEKVLSDLMMVENQIPVFVLETLTRVLFEEFDKSVRIIRLIHKHALSVLGYNNSTLDSRYSKLKAFHFLQLVHSFIYIERNVTDNNGNTDVFIAERKLKLKRCATRLEADGIKIKPPEARGEASNMAAQTRFDLKVTFNDPILQIPQLHITETTEAKWRNLIAWELYRTTLEKLSGKRSSEAGTRCQFICYARFFQSLICCVHDVTLLRERNVIVVHEVDSEEGNKKKIMSNEDLLNLFQKITEGVPVAEIDMDSRFGEVIKKLNKHSTTEDRVTKTRKIIWHAFRCYLTWIWYKWVGAYRVLRRVYIPSGWKLIAVLAAAAGLGLTIAQTVFSALAH